MPTDRLAAQRGAPGFIRCGSGPELTSAALRDWCRFNGAGTGDIDPGSPWQNGYVASFNSRLRDVLLSIEIFDTLIEAQNLLEDWRMDYNWNRPHSALGNQPPAKHAATLKN